MGERRGAEGPAGETRAPRSSGHQVWKGSLFSKTPSPAEHERVDWAAAVGEMRRNFSCDRLLVRHSPGPKGRRKKACRQRGLVSGVAGSEAARMAPASPMWIETKLLGEKMSGTQGRVRGQF